MIKREEHEGFRTGFVSPLSQEGLQKTLSQEGLQKALSFPRKRESTYAQRIFQILAHSTGASAPVESETPASAGVTTLMKPSCSNP